MDETLSTGYEKTIGTKEPSSKICRRRDAMAVYFGIEARDRGLLKLADSKLGQQLALKFSHRVFPGRALALAYTNISHFGQVRAPSEIAVSLLGRPQCIAETAILPAAGLCDLIRLHGKIPRDSANPIL